MIFLPWLNGERTPVDNHHLRGGWFNVALGTGRAELVRSVLEGVALNTRWMNQATEKFTKQRFEHLNFIGRRGPLGRSGARSWPTCSTDRSARWPTRCWPTPGARPSRRRWRSAICGWEDIPSRVEIVETYRPDPANRATYDRLFETFVDLYKKNKGLYARLNRRGARSRRATTHDRADHPSGRTDRPRLPPAGTRPSRRSRPRAATATRCWPRCAEMADLEAARWADGYASGSVYNGDPDHIDFLNQVYALNSQANPLHTDLWPSAVKYESEIVAMTASMLGRRRHRRRARHRHRRRAARCRRAAARASSWP